MSDPLKHVITCPVCGYTMAFETSELVDHAEGGVPVDCTACGNACDPCKSVPFKEPSK